MEGIPFELDLRLIALLTAILGCVAAFLRFRAEQKKLNDERLNNESPKPQTSLQKSGLHILAEKPSGHPFYSFTPQRPSCVVDSMGQIKHELKWDQFVFVPLEPEVQHRITIQVTNTLNPLGVPAGITPLGNFSVKPGEQRQLKYKPPIFSVLNAGIIEFL